MSNTKKSGMIAICGRPNVGKSTLLNALVGEKIAIVTSKPQTTRNRILGVLNRDESQFIFVDTPGLHKARTRLGDYMVQVAKESVSDVDIVLLLVAPIPNVGEPERELIEEIRKLECPAVLAINKIDTLPQKEYLLPVIQAYHNIYPFDTTLPLSAKRGEGLNALIRILDTYLPEGPWLFPEDMITDQPERQLIAEILREKMLLCLDQEVPHGVAVEITQFRQREDRVIECDAMIYCEKNSHKGIIIGKRGTMLKEISTRARQDIERMTGNRTYLKTWVKVKENWRDNVNWIRDFGYRYDG